LKLFCVEHFNEGYPYQISSSDDQYNLVFCGYCVDCWGKQKKESNNLAIFSLLLVVFILSLLLVLCGH